MNTTKKFPSSEWMLVLKDKLNTDQQYAHIAKGWEGDLRLIIDPDASFPETIWLYFDLWHGTCRDAYIEDQNSTQKPVFVLKAPYKNYIKILSGELGAMQALMTRQVSVRGNMAYMMRNIPTVLDFVRCCQEVTQSWI